MEVTPTTIESPIVIMEDLDVESGEDHNNEEELHVASPTTPSREKEDTTDKTYESPSKKAKTDQPIDSQLQDITPVLIPNNPYKMAKEDYNFEKTTKSRVSAGRKKKKSTNTKTYLRVKLPSQVDNVTQWGATINEAILLLHIIWKTLCEVDPQNTTIEPWNVGPNSRTKPLKRESTMPNSRNKIDKKYVEQLKISWSSSNTPTEIRFILGHKKPIQAYLTNKEVDKKLEDIEAEAYVDRVQAEKEQLRDT